MGEHVAKLEEVERIEKLAASLPEMRDRLWELQTLMEATEALLQSIKPGWQRDTIDPVRPHVHQIPIKLGEASRKGLEVLRTATEPMTTHEIADEILSHIAPPIYPFLSSGP
jgi:capsular polysaccharide biosynthesis protein